MSPKQNSPSAKIFVPSPEHQLALGAAHQLVSSFTAYGKVITGISITPSEAGTYHPQGKDENLQLALVFGLSDSGHCIRLPQPQKVYLPSPDGPADGCGWDPTEYVVWKSLPRGWNTIHVQTDIKPLAMAFQPLISTVSTSLPFLEDVLNDDWLNTSTHVNINPSDTLGALWAKYGAGDYTAGVIQRLINAIQNAYSVSPSPSSLPATLAFSQLQILVGHA